MITTSMRPDERETSAALELGLPRHVWNECRRGAARLTLHNLDAAASIELDVSRPIHLVMPGLYGVKIDSPWYEASKIVDLTTERWGRCIFRPSDLHSSRIDSFRLSTDSPDLQGYRGAIWLRVVEGPVDRERAAQYDLDILDGDTIRFLIGGKPRPLRVHLLVPGQGEVAVAVAVVESQGTSQCEGMLRFDLSGGLLTLTTGSRGSLIPRVNSPSHLLQSASEGAVKLAPSSDECEDVASTAERAYHAVRAGEFDEVAPLLERLLNDEVFVSDGYALMAEWYSNAGCHLSALNTLSQMLAVGPPMLSGSYGLAISRLSAMSKTRQALSDTYQMRASLTERSDRSSDLFSRLVTASEGQTVPYLRGQQLEPWNIREATRALDILTRRVAAVDWGSRIMKYVIRPPSNGTFRLLSRANAVAVTRLRPGWSFIKWRMCPGSAELDLPMIGGRSK